MTIDLKIPKDIQRSMKVPEKELPQRLKTELAIRLYQTGILAFGKARKLASMTKWDFEFILGKENIPSRYDVDNLGKDLATLEKISDCCE